MTFSLRPSRVSTRPRIAASLPKGIVKNVSEVIKATNQDDEAKKPEMAETVIVRLEDEMRKAAEELRFEDAAKIRDKIKRLRQTL